jgi:glucosamine kinase
VDDCGSGADIGRRAVRAALRAVDDAPEGRAPTEGLIGAILAFGNGPQNLVDWSVGATPAAFGALAPMVFTFEGQGDPVAAAIVGRALAELERLILLAAAHGAARVSVLGSVGARLAPRLSGRAAALVAPAAGDATLGAALAVRLGRGWSA